MERKPRIVKKKSPDEFERALDAFVSAWIRKYPKRAIQMGQDELAKRSESDQGLRP